MRPGKMRHAITLQRAAVAPNEYGTEVQSWSDMATLRAELVEAEELADASAEAGGKGARRVKFRTRVFGGVTLEDRVIWRGGVLRIVAVTDPNFGWGEGLVLTCEGAA